MSQEIDSLDLRVQTSVVNMDSTFDRLGTQLQNLAQSVSSASRSVGSFGKNVDKFNKVRIENVATISSGLRDVARAMNDFNSVTVDVSKIEGLASAIRKFGIKNATSAVTNLPIITDCIEKLSNALQGFNSNSDSASSIVTIADAIRKLGGAKIEKAIQNLPSLTTELERMITTLSKAPQVSAGTQALINSIAQISNKGINLKGVSEGMSKGFNKASVSTRGLNLRFISLASIMGTLYANFFLIKRIASAMWNVSENAMNYVETYNYFAVALEKVGRDYANAMGEKGEDAALKYYDSFSDTLKKATEKMSGYEIGKNGELTITDKVGLGLDPNEILNFDAKIVQITNSVGMLGETSVNTANSLSKLAYDLSSLTNTDVSTVMQNLTSGLTGSAKALYKYGIDITNATLQEVALSLGISKSVSEMTQQEKMQLRIIQILNSTKSAWGDQANTISSVANQYRVLKQSVQKLGVEIGAIFLPIINKVLPYINGMTIALTRLFQTFGLSLYGDAWWSELLDSISGYNNDSDSLFDDLIDGAEDSSDAVKKLNKQLQGFDELNNLSDTSSSLKSSADAISGLDLSKYINAASQDYENAWNKAFDGMKNKAEDFANVFTEKLKPVQELFDDIMNGDWKKVGEDISNITIDFFETITGALGKVDWQEIGSSIAEFLNGIDWVKVFSSGVDFVGKLLDSAFKMLEGFAFSSDTETRILALLGGALAAILLTKSIPISKINATVAGITIAWAVGFNVGKEIGKQLFPDDKIEYEELTVKNLVVKLYDATDVDFEYSDGTFADFISDKLEKTFGQSTFEKTITWAGLKILLLPETLGIAFSQENMDSIFDADDGYIAKFFNKLPQTIAKFITNIPQKIADVTGLESPQGILAFMIFGYPVGKAVDNLFSALEYAFSEHTMDAIFDEDDGIIAIQFKLIKEDFMKDFNKLKSDINLFIQTTKTIVISVSLLLATKVGTFVSNIKSSLSKSWGTFTASFGVKCSTNTSTLAKNTKTSLNNAWGTVTEKFSVAMTDPTRVIKNGKNLIYSTWGTVTVKINAVFGDIKSAWNELAKTINSKLTLKIDTTTSIGKSLMNLFGTSSVKLGNIPMFKNGGYLPRSMGSLFLAGENGITEMYGNINGRPAIASGTEITGITDAINKQAETEAALLNALITVIKEKDTSISSDDIFKSVRKSANSYQRTTGNPAFGY